MKGSPVQVRASASQSDQSPSRVSIERLATVTRAPMSELSVESGSGRSLRRTLRPDSSNGVNRRRSARSARRPPAPGQRLDQAEAGEVGSAAGKPSTARRAAITLCGQSRYGGGGIRTHEPPCDGQRFSRPPRSTAPAPLREIAWRGDSRLPPGREAGRRRGTIPARGHGAPIIGAHGSEQTRLGRIFDRHTPYRCSRRRPASRPETERVGFEPTRRVNPAHAISNRAP